MKYYWKEKLDSGEYILTWRGFNPFYLGCSYGDRVILGGEEEFNHCYGFYFGIGDVEWWIKEELEKLTNDKKNKLYYILKRNKEVNDFFNKDVCEELKEEIGLIENHHIYRLGNKKMVELYLSNDRKQIFYSFDCVLKNPITFGIASSFVPEEKLEHDEDDEFITPFKEININ